MSRGPLLPVVAVAFAVLMGVLYAWALRDAPAPEDAASVESAPGVASVVKSAPKSRPTSKPTRPLSRKAPRSSSPSLRLDADPDEEQWSPNLHRIEGRVIGDRGRPVGGAKVTYRTDGKKRTTRADEDGNFVVSARGKKVTLHAQRKDGLFTVRSEPVTVEGEAGEWEVDLVLENTRHGGLGVGVAKHREGLRLRSVVSGGPGEEIGLTKGDVILEVGGTTLAGMSTRQASDLLIGPEGTSQTIRVRHKDGEEGSYTFRRRHIDKY